MRVEASGAELRGELGMDTWVEGGALVASETSSSAPEATIVLSFWLTLHSKNCPVVDQIG